MTAAATAAREETLQEMWDRISRSVFVKFRSTTGALIVLYVDHAPFAFAHKLDDTWFDGRYVPNGFLRTAIPDATTLERLPLLDADEALARICWTVKAQARRALAPPATPRSALNLQGDQP